MTENPPPLPRWEPGRRGLGVCYYPEHWPESAWAEDARRMAETGIRLVRIGEFAWSRLEPAPGRFDFAWLDRAIDTLAAAGLGIILGTPTATPPRWMLERHPDMLPVDAAGRPRGFGSRRHYCFSHAGYREEGRRIAEALARRYGRHPALVAWQIDNEYGCHDTAVSYSEAARAAFATWCAARYGSPERLNAAWGNVFWSMEVERFDQIALPVMTVTEPNPAHALAFRRFSLMISGAGTLEKYASALSDRSPSLSLSRIRPTGSASETSISLSFVMPAHSSNGRSRISAAT